MGVLKLNADVALPNKPALKAYPKVILLVMQHPVTNS